MLASAGCTVHVQRDTQHRFKTTHGSQYVRSFLQAAVRRLQRLCAVLTLVRHAQRVGGQGRRTSSIEHRESLSGHQLFCHNSTVFSTIGIP